MAAHSIGRINPVRFALVLASMVLCGSVFSFMPGRYLLLLSICATIWKPNGAKSTCQIWAIGKAKLNTGPSPCSRRALSA